MTYQELVNKIQTIVNEHYMLVDFGYGDLSDLKTRFENTSGNEQVQADYPYCFLNPTSHSRNQSAVTYNFNMIVMDMARGEVSDDPFNNMLAIQSQCQQYIDDIIAHLWTDADPKMNVIYSNLTYTPFNERFSDDVAGMTASLQIQVSVPINDCIAPFIPVAPVTPIVADFSANDTTPAEGDMVTFTDLSTGDPTEWAWTFENGTPATSTLQNPVIQYNTIGNYNVSLTASKVDSSDSITKTDYIQVSAPAGELLFEWSNNTTATLNPNTGNARFGYNVMLTDPNNYWQIVQIKNTLPVGSYKLVMAQDVKFFFDPPTYIVPSQPVLRKRGAIILEYIPATTASGWPTSYDPAATYSYAAEYYFDIVEGDELTTEDIFIQDTPLEGDRTIVQQLNGNIKLYTA